MHYAPQRSWVKRTAFLLTHMLLIGIVVGGAGVAVLALIIGFVSKRRG